MHCASCTKEFADLHLTSKQKKVLENELEDGSSLCPKLLSPLTRTILYAWECVQKYSERKGFPQRGKTNFNKPWSLHTEVHLGSDPGDAEGNGSIPVLD